MSLHDAQKEVVPANHCYCGTCTATFFLETYIELLLRWLRENAGYDFCSRQLRSDVRHFLLASSGSVGRGPLWWTRITLEVESRQLRTSQPSRTLSSLAALEPSPRRGRKDRMRDFVLSLEKAAADGCSLPQQLDTCLTSAKRIDYCLADVV